MDATELALFAVGTFWFWVLACATILVLFVFIETNKPGLATVSLIAVFAILAFFGDFNILTWATEHPRGFVFACSIYVAVGIGWSFGKWWFFVHDKSERRKRAHTAFLEQHQMTQMHPELVYQWSHSLAFNETRKPRAREHIDRLVLWSCYWPWSFVWTMLNDPVRKLFRSLVEQLHGWYDAVATRAYDAPEDADV